MSRKLRIAVAVSVLLGGIPLDQLRVAAQTGRPSTRQDQFQNGPGQKPARPQPNALRQERISPEMLLLLQEWEVASGAVRTLQGSHKRFVYDRVFNVEKQSEGFFYYEAPDKGRIDLKPVKIREGSVSRRKDSTGKPYQLQADRPEKWICTGETIWQIDDAAKTAQSIPIPPESRRENIMDGPLPFLFGMPANKARMRYRLQFDPNKPANSPANQIWLKVWPKWSRDAANWSEAKVILNRATYLPMAVRMVDPSGNLETVYTFRDLKVNKRSILPWKGDPFDVKPLIKGYEIILSKDQPTVPSVIGLSAKNAKELLEKLGYKKIKWRRGVKTENPKLTYVVYVQDPKAKSELAKEQAVTLTVYDAPQPKQPNRPKDAAMVPSVVGLPYKKAHQLLTQSGYMVRGRRGATSKTPDKIYVVYQQQPQGRTPLAKGETITLTVYDDPQKAPRR